MIVTIINKCTVSCSVRGLQTVVKPIKRGAGLAPRDYLKDESLLYLKAGNKKGRRVVLCVNIDRQECI